MRPETGLKLVDMVDGVNTRVSLLNERVAYLETLALGLVLMVFVLVCAVGWMAALNIRRSRP